LRQFGEEQVHRGGVELGQHQCHAGVARRAHRADDPGGAVAEVAPPARGMAALPPNITGAPFLADPRLVLAPDLEVRCFGVSLDKLLQARGEPPFLKVSCAF